MTLSGQEQREIQDSMPEKPLSLAEIAINGELLIDDLIAGRITPKEAKEKQRAFLKEAAGRHQVIEGIHNKERFSEELEEAVSRAKRDKSHLSLILIDLDGFKAVNTLAGHSTGDQVLRTLGPILLNAAQRKTDEIAGIGGDEVAFLVQTDNVHALVVAHKLLKNIPSISPINPQDPNKALIPITASIGVTEFDLNNSGETKESFFDRADKALYTAKNRGKNSIALNATYDPQFSIDKLKTTVSQLAINPVQREETINGILDNTILVRD